jgi:hypothetical protein
MVRIIQNDLLNVLGQLIWAEIVHRSGTHPLEVEDFFCPLESSLIVLAQMVVSTAHVLDAVYLLAWVDFVD